MSRRLPVKRRSKRYLLLSLVIALVGAATIFVSPSAKAFPPTGTVPDAGDFTAGGAVYAEVSITGPGDSLQAPEDMLNLYFPVSSGTSQTAQLLEPDACAGNPDEDPGAAFSPIVSQYHFLNAVGNPIYQSRISPAACATGDIVNAPLNLSGAPKVNLAGGQFYLVQLDVVAVSGSNGVNAFKAVVPGGYANYTNAPPTYNPGAGPQFALQERDSAGNTNQSTFSLYFQPDCSSANVTAAQLEWYDADWGVLQFNANFGWNLYDITTGTLMGSLTGSGTFTDPYGDVMDLGGSHAPRQAKFNFNKTHVYRWQWTGVYKDNGIQFQLPFNSINTIADCTVAVRTPVVNVSGDVYNTQDGTEITDPSTGSPGIFKIESCLTSEPANDTPPSGAASGIVSMATTPDGNGWWTVDANGNVYAYGSAVNYGSSIQVGTFNTFKSGSNLARKVVQIVATKDGKGYWIVANDGGVFTHGDAPWHGSLGATELNNPIVGMAPTSTDGGYIMAGSDGGAFAFGAAPVPSPNGLAGIALAKPIVGIAMDLSNGGYWMVGADGGVFTFGNAGFYGSEGGVALSKPIVGMAVTPDSRGYWLLGADGGIFQHGDAGFYGSFAGGGIATADGTPFVAIARTIDGKGYYAVHQDGYIDGSDPIRSPGAGVAHGDAFVFYTHDNGAGHDSYVFPIGGVSPYNAYCVRVLNPPTSWASAWVGPTLNGAYACGGGSYEWQKANAYIGSPGCPSGRGFYDLSFDNNHNFGYGPQANLSCNANPATSDPDPADYGKLFNVTVSFDSSSDTIGSTLTVSSSPATITGLPFTDNSYNVSKGTNNYTVPNLSASNAGLYTITVTVTGGGIATPVSCHAPIYVGYQPFMSVLGGNIFAGVGYGSSCSANTAGIYSNNNGGSPGNPYFGSGSQMAALAAGTGSSNIEGFASALNGDGTSSLGGGALTNPFQLDFANANVATYGNLDALSPWACVPDYSSTVVPTSSLSGNQTIGATSLINGQKMIIKVNGNVYINGNITYNAYGSLANMPLFELVVNGTISIAPTVSRLDGVYIAQGGSILTCGDSSFNPIKDYNQCKQNPLTFNGSVSTSSITLGRTYGNPIANLLDGTPAKSAETFQFSPEVWITQTSTTPPTTPNLPYITSLPPVL